MSKNVLTVYRSIAQRLKGVGGFGSLFDKAEFVKGDEGQCTFKFKVEERHTNPGGTMHGGMTATLVDIVSTVAIMSKGDGHPGVSVDMNISYLAPAPQDADLLVHSTVDRMGRSLAFTSTTIKLADTEKVVALGRHTKAFPRK